MQTLSRCEEEIMAVIYEADHLLGMRDTMERANEKFGVNWKPQTVSSYLARVVKKGYLTMARKGRVTYYTPTISKEDYVRAKADMITQNFFGGNKKEFLKCVKA